MKLKRSYLEAGAFIVVYLFALYMWTLPFQDNKVPYGEFDAISHWELGDFISQRDRTFVYLPAFLDYSYGGDNKFKPHTLWYHPPFHTDFAIISAFSNDRMVPIYLTNAIFASAILISVFFVIRRLFGFLPAILSSFMLTFSMRDIMPYLWGQWPERFAYAFIPLILYCFYMYYTTYSKEKNKPIYLYIMSLLLAVNVFIHPLVFFHSLVGLFVLGVALAIKQKKIPFNTKQLGIALLIFLVLFSIFPYQSGNVIVSFFGGSTPEEMKHSIVSRLLQWAPNAEDFVGSVPASYFSFKDMHGLWTLPFLLIGLLILVVRRENRDIFLLAWLISLYLVLHRDLIGMSTFLHRSLSASAHIFVPITVIGALSLFSLIKLPKIYKSFLKYGAAILVVALTLVYNFPAAQSTLDNAYDSPLIRINPAQVEVSEWLKDNIDENDNVSVIGPPPEIMQKVWWMASYSHRTSHYFEGFLTWGTFEENREETIRYHILNDYVVFDYSDIALLSDRSLVEQWLAFEKQNFGNHTLVYNKDNIRVYKYEPS
ncbi:MAG: glycosyltransferase family 39 protein [Nanoarchaeota archaeon]|nr:glycosyltransferase family 39 protein [Nanoarchaeota archaeon]